MKTQARTYGRFYNVDEENDIWLPSVTTILSNMTDKSGIDDWINNVGEEAAKKISTYSANRGTFMHLLCENYLRERFEKNNTSQKLLKEVFEKTLEDKEISTFDRSHLIAGKNLFMNFYRDNTFDRLSEVVLQEVALWSLNGGGYAGRVDLIARLVNKTLVVIDFKSSGKPKKADWILNYFYQASAYAFAYYERYGEMPQKAEIWISNEQTEVPQVFELSLEELKQYYKVFIQLVKRYHKKYLSVEA